MFKYYLLNDTENKNIFFYKYNFKSLFNFYEDLKLLNLNLIYTPSDNKRINIEEYIKIKNFYKLIIIINLLKSISVYKPTLIFKEYTLSEDISKEEFLKIYN